MAINGHKNGGIFKINGHKNGGSNASPLMAINGYASLVTGVFNTNYQLHILV